MLQDKEAAEIPAEAEPNDFEDLQPFEGEDVEMN